MLRVAKTENGMVRGLPAADPRITSFKGIPFAAPPVGENRWRAPQPAEDWEGIKDCLEFKNIPVQDTPGLGTDVYCKEWHVDPEAPMGEDCLYLNIWTPAKKTDEKLPVLVWYFGGALQWGYPSEMEFDGERLARRGIIVVSVNYRLGAIGFMAHPELTKEIDFEPAINELCSSYKIKEITIHPPLNEYDIEAVVLYNKGIIERQLKKCIEMEKESRRINN